MARNHKFYFDRDGTPRARGPHAERVLMTFLEVDVQGSDHICHDLMDDLTAIEDGSAESREFDGNAHSVAMQGDEVVIICRDRSDDAEYRASLKHFREILEDWEAFILDDQSPGLGEPV